MRSTRHFSLIPTAFRRKALSEQLLAMISASASDNRSSERLSLIDRRTVEASAKGNYRPLAASPSPSCFRRLSGSARSVFDDIPRHLLLPPVVELGRPWSAMPGQGLHVIERHALAEQVGDPVTRNECGGSPASFSRRLTIRHTSFVVSGLSVSRFVLPSVERNSGRSLSFPPRMPAVSR